MKKITYNNKQYVLNDPQYPVEETVTDADMNEIKEVVNYNANELENVKDALIHITTEKAESINVKDCSGQNGKIKLFGISRQKISVQGNNILDLSRPLLEGKRYNEQGIEEVDSRANTYSLKLEDGVNYFISIATGGSYYTKWKNNVFVSYEIKSPGVAQETKDDTFDEIRYSLFTDANNFETQYINKNSNTGYEEFVPNMPSPKYISEIENTTENIDITDCNKNLLNWNKIITDSQNTINEGEYIKFYQNANRLNIKDVFKENTQYAFTIIAKKDTANGNFQLYFSYTDGSTETIKIVCTNANTDYKQTFISQANKTIDFIQSTYTDETASYIKIEGTQLEANNVATDYTENEQQTITFPLAEGQKMMEGSETKDDGIHHKRKQVEFNGTENWELYIWQTAPHVKTTIFSLTNVLPQKNDIVKYCNYFNIVENTITNLNKDEAYCLNSSAGTIYFSIPNEIATTTEQFKNWLAQQKQAGTPVIVEYELAEEEIEPYTPEQQEAYDKLQNVLSYYNVTNVFTDKAQLVFKYIADTKTYIDNKYNNLAQQLLNL